MINNKIEDLFKEITNSDEYKRYLEINDIINQDEKISSLIEEIKTLQQEATNLEYHNDLKYLEIDKLVQEKYKILNEDPVYSEYIRLMNDFNRVACDSSHLLQEYINENI